MIVKIILPLIIQFLKINIINLLWVFVIIIFIHFINYVKKIDCPLHHTFNTCDFLIM